MILRSSIGHASYGYLADAAKALKPSLHFGRVLALALAILWASTGAGTPGEVPKILTISGVRKLRDREGCVLIHPWATWCKLCLVELPTLLPHLKRTGVTPVVIDLSEPKVQSMFSVAWAQTLKAPFVLYRRGAASQSDYGKVIDAQWEGGMPFSILYRSGKVLKRWSGKSDIPAFTRELSSFCGERSTPPRQNDLGPG